MIRISLHKGRDRRLRAGHPWVFSNEIAAVTGEISPGVAAAVFASDGAFLGTGYYNPHTLIAARMLSRREEEIDTPGFFRARFEAARDYRRTLYPPEQTGLRLVHGEGDFLPGLVVDSFGGVLAVQLLTAGMEARRAAIITALDDVFAPQAIVARNDVAVRRLEGLEESVQVLAGALPERVEIVENGLRFRVDVLAGQKTGHFLDQKENHRRLQGRVAGARVLDLFCYAGSWGLHAASYGAAQVTAVDISQAALDLARENAALNGLAERFTLERADVFELLRAYGQSGARFDLVVLDPPAFVKSRKKLAEALRGYLTINQRALALVAPGGYLVTCTCSHHVGREAFHELLGQAAAHARRPVRLLELAGQAPDHPVLLACPETAYLTCAVLQVL